MNSNATMERRTSTERLATMEYLASLSNTETVRVEARTLKVHPTAQRRLVIRNVREIEKTLDLDVIGTLSAVEYEINGETALWIVDGQHRLAALMRLGFGEWIVEVRIYLNYRDDASASRLFIKLNKNRRPVNALCDFVNAERAGEADAVGVSRIVSALDLTMSRNNSKSDGAIRCPALVRKIFNYDNGATLTAALETIIAAWGRSEAGFEGKVIDGLGLLYKRYNGNIERAGLVRTLAKYPGGPTRLIGDARGLLSLHHGGTLTQCVAECVLAIYNRKRTAHRLEPL